MCYAMSSPTANCIVLIKLFALYNISSELEIDAIAYEGVWHIWLKNEKDVLRSRCVGVIKDKT